MLASTSSMQLESQSRPFGNPSRLRKIGNPLEAGETDGVSRIPGGGYGGSAGPRVCFFRTSLVGSRSVVTEFRRER
jgi:hypothetical protein